MKRRIKTRTEQASVAGVSVKTLAAWRRRKDWKEAADGSVSAEWLREYAIRRLVAAKAAQRGENSDLKRALLERKIQRLTGQCALDDEALYRSRMETDRAAGELVERTVVRRKLTTLFQAVRNAVDSWEQYETAKTPRLVDTIEALHHRLLDMMREELEKVAGDLPPNDYDPRQARP